MKIEMRAAYAATDGRVPKEIGLEIVTDEPVPTAELADLIAAVVGQFSLVADRSYTARLSDSFAQTGQID